MISDKHKRTEEQMMTMSPLEIQLGQKKYNVPPMTYPRATAWRQSLCDAMKEVMVSFRQPGENDAISNALIVALVQSPEKIVNLVFDFAGERIPREAINEATDEQFTVAFEKMMTSAYPYQPQLKTAASVLGALNSLAPLPRV